MRCNDAPILDHRVVSLRTMIRRLSEALGLDVTVDHRGQGGTLHIKYRDLDQLDGVLRKLDRK